MATSTISLSAVCAILDHERSRSTWIARIGDDGKIERLARVCYLHPRDGAGTLKVAVTDWGKLAADGSPAHYIGKAGGFGYDKAASALAGATIGGIPLGDHCDRDGYKTLNDTCREQGWSVFVG